MIFLVSLEAFDSLKAKAISADESMQAMLIDCELQEIVLRHQSDAHLIWMAIAVIWRECTLRAFGILLNVRRLIAFSVELAVFRQQVFHDRILLWFCQSELIGELSKIWILLQMSNIRCLYINITLVRLENLNTLYVRGSCTVQNFRALLDLPDPKAIVWVFHNRSFDGSLFEFTTICTVICNWEPTRMTFSSW